MNGKMLTGDGLRPHDFMVEQNNEGINCQEINKNCSFESLIDYIETFAQEIFAQDVASNKGELNF